MRVRLPSLETRFIPLSLRKGLSEPSIVFVDAPLTHQGYSGYYDHRTQQIVVATGREDSVETILAHEWRHHWQRHAGWLQRSYRFDQSADYWREIVRYFSFIPDEYDALMFSLGTCSRPDPAQEDWLIRCQQEQLGMFA